jgi:hypothetical protein
MPAFSELCFAAIVTQPLDVFSSTHKCPSYHALCRELRNDSRQKCADSRKVKRKPLNFQNCVKFPIGKFSGSHANSVPCGVRQHRVRYGTSQSQVILTIAGYGMSATIGECRGFPLLGSSHSHGLGRKVELASACGLSQRHDDGFCPVRRSRISDMKLHVLFFGPCFGGICDEAKCRSIDVGFGRHGCDAHRHGRSGQSLWSPPSRQLWFLRWLPEQLRIQQQLQQLRSRCPSACPNL